MLYDNDCYDDEDDDADKYDDNDDDHDDDNDDDDGGGGEDDDLFTRSSSARHLAVSQRSISGGATLAVGCRYNCWSPKTKPSCCDSLMYASRQ